MVFFVVASALATPPVVVMVFIFIAVLTNTRIKCSHFGQKITVAFSNGKCLRVNNAFAPIRSVRPHNDAQSRSILSLLKPQSFTWIDQLKLFVRQSAQYIITPVSTKNKSRIFCLGEGLALPLLEQITIGDQGWTR